jgi:hypothetical protein
MEKFTGFLKANRPKPIRHNLVIAWEHTKGIMAIVQHHIDEGKKYGRESIVEAVGNMVDNTIIEKRIWLNKQNVINRALRVFEDHIKEGEMAINELEIKSIEKEARKNTYYMVLESEKEKIELLGCHFRPNSIKQELYKQQVKMDSDKFLQDRIEFITKISVEKIIYSEKITKVSVVSK